MVHILTPCSRPENLDIIQESIPEECNWIIAYMADKDDKERAGVTQYHTNIKYAPYGHRLRNYILNNHKFADTDWIYFLDDDNIIKDDWYINVKEHLNQDFVIMTWGQIYKDGSHRVDSTYIPKIYTTDTACFMVKWKDIKDIRWGDKSEADGQYAYDCAKRGDVLELIDTKHPTGHGSKYLAYYNYISDRREVS
tara:strand:- start:1681 stop:2265 length:585 start_codon:yes stop_codon:yes gene_type:complete